jgi:hypothetical protein
MILEVDNKGAVDFINGWSVSGRTRHIEVKQYFLRELKEQGIIKIVWKSGDEMTSDIFTKNLPPSLSEYHGHKLYGRKVIRKKLDLSLLNVRESMISIMMCLMI